MTIGFIALGLVLVFLWGVRSYAPDRLGFALFVSVAWCAVFGALAWFGVLKQFDYKPMGLVFLATLVGGLTLGRSSLLLRVVKGAPLWAVVAVQGFRFPLEVAMHDLALKGQMPREMSYTGYNFDIVSGVTALVVAMYLRRGGDARVAYYWNLMASAFLSVIVSIALLASPVIAAFGQGIHLNTFVTEFPFVYLPTVCVLAAFSLHIALLRRLRT